MRVIKGVAAAARKLTIGMFADIGFANHTRDGCGMTKEFSSQVIGIANFGLVTNTGDGLVDLDVAIGISHIELERLTAEFRQKSFKWYESASWGVQLGYAMPDRKYLTWSMRTIDDVPIAVSAMVEAYETYGVPFIQARASLMGVLELLVERESRQLEPKWYRIPVAMLLLGNPIEARQYVVQKVQELRNQTDLATLEFNAFAQCFLEYTNNYIQ